jgi:hypothetical protein
MRPSFAWPRYRGTSGPLASLWNCSLGSITGTDTRDYVRFLFRIVSRDGYFVESFNILNSTFCEGAGCLQGLSNAFHFPIQLFTFKLLL